MSSTRRATFFARVRYAFVLVGLLAAAGCTEATIQSRAANDFQCARSEVSLEQVTNYSYRASGCGESGIYYVADRVGHDIVGPVKEPSSDTPPPPAPSPPQPAVLLQPPSGAGGFAFGETADEARQACEQGGHAYATVTAGKAVCDGVVADVGAPARAALTYCDGRVCAVSLQVPLAPSDDAAHALVHWRSELVSKYGGPSEAQTDVPDRCDHDVTPCLLDGTGTIQFDWRWPNRQTTTLGLQLDGARKPWMDIAYTAPPSTPEAAGL